MSLRDESGKCIARGKYVIPVIFSMLFCSGAVWAQVTASITGAVKDTSGAVIPDVAVTVKNVDTGLTRTVQTDAAGNYSVLAIPVGQYEVSTDKVGFKEEIRQGITLVVGQQAVVNLTLEIGSVQQQVTVTAEAPLVNTTTSQTSGLVNEQEVKDLPLNGRSFDQLLTLNVGTTNYSSNTSHNAFSVSGQRPETNRFIINGMDYVGSDSSSQTVTPNSVSGDILGVDAVREFNVVQPPYGAEYGKRGGGQVSIVTSSGTNGVHGDLFEFLRNSDMDARNFFDFPVGTRIPPFKRNQFGGSLGGPVKKDKLFFFVSYEGLRQSLGQSDTDIVPDNQTRAGIGPYAPAGTVVVPGMLPFFSLWPAPNGPEVLGLTGQNAGLAIAYANPVQTIREDFGLGRADYTISDKDTLSATYLDDNGEMDTPTATEEFLGRSRSVNTLASLQETHIFSPTLLNVVTLGLDRSFTPTQTLPLVPIPPDFVFITGQGAGTFSIGGGIVGTVASSVTGAGGDTVPLAATRNLVTIADDVHMTKGNHSLSLGVWVQREQQDLSGAPAGQGGSVTFSNFTTFLEDEPTQFIGVPNPTALYYRTTEAAWYVQDDIKVKPNFTLRVGLRDEMTTGWNAAHGNCPNYQFTNGIINTLPFSSTSCLTQNNAYALWQPRLGFAWDPTGKGTWALRGGFGIYNDLQDSLAHRLNSDPPADARITLNTPLLSYIPLPAAQPAQNCNAQLVAANQPCSIFMVGGLEPNLYTPTIEEWNLTVERQLTKDLALQLSYVGAQSYHLPVSVDANEAQPVLCQIQAGCPSGGTAGAVGVAPFGAMYQPPVPKPTNTNSSLPNPYVGNTFSWWYEGNSNYEAGTVSLIGRQSHGLGFKVNYTYSKVMDFNSAISASNGTNEPQTIYNIYDLALNKGVAAFSLRHQFNANFNYELPFGKGRAFASGVSPIIDKVIGGWQWNGIWTVQSGFPFTPQTGSNRDGSGDTFNADVPNWNPAFTGPVVVGSPTEYFNPLAFTLPPAGTYGDVSRGSLTGPGLFDFDTSLFKTIPINERWHAEFRAEVFNIFNNVNFGEPTAVVFSGTNYSPSAGTITSEPTKSRQIQLALKLIF